MKNFYTPSRRQFLAAIPAGLTALVCGCSEEQCRGRAVGRQKDTGIPGLETPEEILSNPVVEDIINQFKESLRDLGAENDLNLSHALNPPFIEGDYEIFQGFQFVPNVGIVGDGNFSWKNQTCDNHIETVYNENFEGPGVQTINSPKWEIIRGEENIFTVYSIVSSINKYPDKDNCQIDAVFLWDGFLDHDNNGKRGALVGYCQAPLENLTPNNCDPTSSAGVFIIQEPGYSGLTFSEPAKKIANRIKGKK